MYDKQALDRIGTGKKFYAGLNTYGTQFAYNSGWTAKVFDSKAERDVWVNADTYPNGNPTREAISRKIAYRIAGISGAYYQAGKDEYNNLIAVYVG